VRFPHEWRKNEGTYLCASLWVEMEILILYFTGESNVMIG